INNEQKNDLEPDESGSIFILFEQEFGRPLSPFEIETITVWLDEDLIQPSLIKAGLRESVLMGKLNFRYIDRILREWQKKEIKSLKKKKKEIKRFKKNNQQKNKKKKKEIHSINLNC